ncbi:helix-turn-helix domain-containing protein [Halorubrum tropicale]|uniref:Bacterio-opsin activator n=1 Tax=Halorubrum tropicale TaxID=1765655 RepID=A0A0M9AQM2_9EURY|nr:helix-turn-helix domain-containing protein [Halorubrum tropicale]KOX96879.1 bacterio-opsin activator [Halorubrum tropicale]
MSRTELRLGLPTGSWLGDVSRRVPAATLRVAETIAVDGSAATDDDGLTATDDDGLTATEADLTAAATVRVGGTDRDRVEAALREHDRVDRATAVERRGDVRTLRVVGRAPAYLPAARAVGLPIAAAVEVVDGRAAVSVVGDRDRVEAFGRRLAADGVTVGVAATGSDEPERTLTEAQRELVFEAVKSGYYDTPRRCTLTELAAANDIAKSTCSETLHRAEGRVMRRFVDGGGPFSASEAGDVDDGGGENVPTETAALDGEESDAAERAGDELDGEEFDAAEREEPVRSAATEP